MKKPKRSIFGLINKKKLNFHHDDKLNDFIIGEEEAFTRRKENESRFSILDDVIGNEHGVVQERQKTLPKLDFEKLNRMSAKEQIRTLKQAYIDIFDEFELKISEQMKLEADLSNAKLEAEKERKERLFLKEFIRDLVGMIPDAYDLKLKMDTTDWSVGDIRPEVIEKMEGLNAKARGVLGEIEKENDLLRDKNNKLEKMILKYKKDILRYENGLEKYKENNEKIKEKYYELAEKFKQLRKALQEERMKNKQTESIKNSRQIEEIKENYEMQLKDKTKKIKEKEEEIQKIKEELQKIKTELGKTKKALASKKRHELKKTPEKEISEKREITENSNMFDKIVEKTKTLKNELKEEEIDLKDEVILTGETEQNEAFDVDLDFEDDFAFSDLDDDMYSNEDNKAIETDETEHGKSESTKEEEENKNNALETQENKVEEDDITLDVEFDLEDIGFNDEIDEVADAKIEDMFELDDTDMNEDNFEKKEDETKIKPSELPKYVFIDTDLYTSDLDEMHDYLVQVIGETGISRNSKLKEYIKNDREGKELFMSNNKINNNEIYSKIKHLREKNILNHEQVKLGGMHAYNFTAYELSDVGKSYYYKLTRKLPKESEMSLVKKEHDSLSHGYLIIESAEEFEKMGYKIYTDRKSCTVKLPNNKRKVFDLILEKDGKKMYVEVETGTHNEDDFAKAMDKIYEITQDVYFIAPNSSILVKETKTNVFKWINKRGGIESMRGKLTLNFTTLDKIKKKAKTLWETMPL